MDEGGQSGVSRLTPQQAIRILSLRVPESQPANAPINRSLLMSPGGQAAGASGLQSMIQQLIQAFKPPMDTPAPVLPSMPSQPGRQEVPGQMPQGIDTGQVSPSVRGPHFGQVNVPPMQAPSPTPAQPTGGGGVTPPHFMPGYQGPAGRVEEPEGIGDPWASLMGPQGGDTPDPFDLSELGHWATQKGGGGLRMGGAFR